MKGQKIREWREEKGLSRDQLADLCSVSYATVANWELDRNAPRGAALKTLRELMEGKDLTIHTLSQFEMTVLDEIVKRRGFRSREDFLTHELRQAIVENSCQNDIHPPDHE